MAQLMQYVARKQFKYDGRWFQPGDVWEPVGGRFDAQIIRNKFVVIEEADEPETEADETEARPRRQVKRGATKR